MDSTCDLATPALVFEGTDDHASDFAGPGRPADQGSPDVGRILRVLARGLPVILVCLGLGLWAGVAALRALPAQYASTAALLIDPKRPGALGADAAFANLLVDSSKVASVELVLASSELLGRVVQSARLDLDPAFGAARTSLPRRWLTSLVPDLFRPLADTAEARRSRAVYRLGRSMRIARVGMTYVINVTVTAPAAIQAQFLASSVVDAYLSDQIDIKVGAARRDSAWLAGQLAQMRRTLSDNENAVEAVRRRYGIGETDHAAGPSLDREAATDINTQLQQAEGLVAVSRAKYDQARRLLETRGSLDELPEVSGSPVIAGLRAQQADARRRLARLAGLYTNAYPELAHARADNRTLDGEVEAEMRRIVAGLGHAEATSVALRDALRQRLSALVGAASTADRADGRIQLRQAQRTLEANQLAYSAAQARLSELEQQPTRQDAEIRVISSPDLPDSPSFPKPVLFLGGGGALGLLAGMGGVFLVSLLRKRVEGGTVAGRKLALPLLATVPCLSRPDLPRGDAAAGYLTANPVSAFADSLRLLRAALRRAGGMPQVVQLTSARRGEGKSTLSASLAISAALAGIRTVIVDLDFYNPRVCSLFNVPEDQGIGDVLGGMDYAALPRAWHAGLTLRVIGAGTRHKPLADALDGPAFRSLMAALRNEYDLIVLDTPPVLAVADALLVARHADATIMVCAWRATPQKSAEQAVQALRLAHAHLAGLVVNKVAHGGTRTYPGDYYAHWRRRTALPTRTDAAL